MEKAAETCRTNERKLLEKMMQIIYDDELHTKETSRHVKGIEDCKCLVMKSKNSGSGTRDFLLWTIRVTERSASTAFLYKYNLSYCITTAHDLEQSLYSFLSCNGVPLGIVTIWAKSRAFR